MNEAYDIPLALVAALAIGLLIGLERGWNDRHEDEGDRIGGLRTFGVIGLLGGISGLLSAEMGPWVLAAAFLAVAALIVAAHVLDVREDEDVGSTTAFAMLLTFSLAAWSTFGYPIHALGATVAVMALLGAKPTLHGWLRNIEPRELNGAIKLLIISVVLLPLLPDEGYGPWEALNPYWIWWMVVLISGLSFLGYFAIKLAGERTGTILTAIAGGLASSTAVTVSFAQLARKREALNVLMGGVMLASSIMFVRVIVEVSIVNPALLSRVLVPMVVMGAGMVAGGVWLLRSGGDEAEAGRETEVRNPLQLGTALRFGALLAVILMLSEGMQEWFGDEGIYVLAVVSGLMDVDAITVSLSRMARESISEQTAVVGIVLAAATNTLVKGALFAFYVGARRSIRLIGTILLVVGVGVAVAFFRG
jgi:uncharacterized membrane protein (DUF4010 family)